MSIKVTILSAGLGNISRGFESTSLMWYEVIRENKKFNTRIFAGGKYGSATKVWNLPRNGWLAALLRRTKVINDGCRLEQISFAFGFLFHLLLYKPHVIWLQEGTLGTLLLKFRKLFGFRYKLLFCDGAPLGHTFADRFDYIIFLHQYAHHQAIKDGIRPGKCRTIPYPLAFPDFFTSRDSARRKLRLPPDKFVVICVAAWNKHHKRINYLLSEMAKIDPSKVTLLLCGQPEKETIELKETAERLGLDTHWYTLSRADLSTAYFSADVFVLPSLQEGFGAVLLEAGSHNLPVICHSHDAGKFIFGEDYTGLTDLSKEGNLAAKIEAYMNEANLVELGTNTLERLQKKFDRNVLSNSLVELIEHANAN